MSCECKQNFEELEKRIEILEVGIICLCVALYIITRNVVFRDEVKPA